MKPITPIIDGKLHMSASLKQLLGPAPGPWMYLGNGDIICGQAPDTHDIATVYPREDGTQDANGLLLASAHFMLAILHRIALFDKYEPAGPAAALARSAIAVATPNDTRFRLEEKPNV